MKLCVASLFAAVLLCMNATAQTAPASSGDPSATNPLDTASKRQPHEYGVVFQGGNGLTDNRGGFHFLQAGVHVGRVLTNNMGNGIFRGNFEYAGELFPFWIAYTPKFPRVSCAQIPGSALLNCSQPYLVGGTFHGVTLTPIILRWNFARHGRFTPWFQAAGGLLYTTHKFPSYGDTTANYNTNGPNGETSVWNFTPQGGIGFHYFLKPDKANLRTRSIDFSANGEHISSASLGDRNPGVNASVQFTVGYTWWK